MRQFSYFNREQPDLWPPSISLLNPVDHHISEKECTHYSSTTPAT